jgi:hypothetical protein
MAVRKFKPVTPGQRHKVIGTFEEITASVPEKSLVFGKRSTGGRNNTGKMTVRYMGGGHKKKYRLIDFKREKDGVPAVVKTIEYDPNRSARIALLFYADGEKRYIIAPNGLEVGAKLMSGAEAAPEVGNALPLANIPVGTVIHNIELRPGQSVRSKNVTFFTICIEQQSDASRAVRIILDCLYYSWNTILLSLEVDQTILLLVAAAHVADSHLTGVVSTTSRTLTENERLLWHGCSNLLERANNLVSLSRSNRFKFTYCHFLF